MDWPTIVHVAGGGVALIAGAVALILRKGSKNHKRSGYWFVVAMLVMAVPGGVISYAVGKPFDMLSSVVAIYMVLTGWLAFRPVSPRGYLVMMGGAALCVLSYLSIELYAVFTSVRATDAPPGAGYIFASILALSFVGDVKRLRHPFEKKTQKKQQMIRHLWRLNFGLFMATASFFGARPHLFADWMQAYGVLLVLTIAPVVVMAYWRFRLR